MSTIACPHCNGAIVLSASPVGAGAPPPRVAHAGDLGECPDHRTAWVFKSGISKKTGQAYAFWSCDGRDNGEYCRRKPDPRWTPPAPPQASDIPF